MQPFLGVGVERRVVLLEHALEPEDAVERRRLRLDAAADLLERGEHGVERLRG